MDEEDLLPQRQPVKPRDLTLLGIAELEEYIAGLESEIARARAEIVIAPERPSVKAWLTALRKRLVKICP